MSFAKLDNEGRNMFWHSGCKQCWDIFSVKAETVVFQYVCMYVLMYLSILSVYLCLSVCLCLLKVEDCNEVVKVVKH